MHKGQLSRAELRAVHRRLRRWGRDLPQEEFANWHFDREVPRRAWRKARQRQRLLLVYGTMAAAMLTIAAAQRLPALPHLAFWSQQSAARPRLEFVVDGAAGQPSPGPVALAEHAPVPWQPSPERAVENGMKTAVAETLTQHADTASVIVAGLVEAIAADAVVVRVELALRGETTDVLHIPLGEDPDALARLQAGSVVLAYLAAASAERVDDSSAVAAVSDVVALRPAGPGALVALSTLTDDAQ